MEKGVIFTSIRIHNGNKSGSKTLVVTARYVTKNRITGHLVVAAHFGLEGEEEDLEVALLHELGRLLHVPVGVELAQLLLDAAQRVGKLPVGQRTDHLHQKCTVVIS